MIRTFAVCLALLAFLSFTPTAVVAAEPALSALIVDGQNNHDWPSTTPLLMKMLEDSGLFRVDVATSPPGVLVVGFIR